ncbi:MAG: hypothetical protein HY063_14810 [Bacteroidetes bacterium]|nr:hypothetical protein [Bacteroidota bacterium]
MKNHEKYFACNELDEQRQEILFLLIMQLKPAAIAAIIHECKRNVETMLEEMRNIFCPANRGYHCLVKTVCENYPGLKEHLEKKFGKKHAADIALYGLGVAGRFAPVQTQQGEHIFIENVYVKNKKRYKPLPKMSEEKTFGKR